MLKTLHFHHKIVHVTDLERSERFFGDALELEPVGRDLWPDEAGPTSTFRTANGQYVVLVQVPHVDREVAEHWNFMLSADDFPRISKKLRDLGSNIGDLRSENRAIGEMSDNYYDPDGQIMQMTAIAPEAFDVPAARLGKVVAGQIDDFAVGSVTYVPKGRFFVVRTKDGVLAISQVCTHRQWKVEYQPWHYRFFCSRHHNKFTRTGAHIGHTPGTPPLHVYAIEFVDGQIVVDTDTSIPRTADEADQVVPLPVALA